MIGHYRHMHVFNVCVCVCVGIPEEHLCACVYFEVHELTTESINNRQDVSSLAQHNIISAGLIIKLLIQFGNINYKVVIRRCWGF